MARCGSRVCTSHRTSRATGAGISPPGRGSSSCKAGQQQEQRITLVPLRVYFTHGLAKVEIGLGRGKREHEVREALKKREHEREIEREMGRRR